MRVKSYHKKKKVENCLNNLIYITTDDNIKIKLYTILKKSKEKVLEFYKGTAKVLWIVYMVDYSKVNDKLSNSQLNKLKTVAKNQALVNLRMNIKMLNGNNLPPNYWQQEKKI